MYAQFKSYLAAFCLLASVQALVACDKTGGPAAPSAAALPQAHGTSDSGGGTGVDGKVFESYIVDPTALPAFKEIVAPLLSNFLDDKGKPSRFESLTKMKTWYIAPIELEKIGKATLGVSFMQNETDQIARQTSTEVWISKPMFDKMDHQAQGELLLHEFVMELYFTKFMTVGQLCSTFNDVQNNTEPCPTGAAMAAFEKAMPPEKAHALNEEDNANIRYVTGWILQNGHRAIAPAEYNKLFQNKHFDPRVYRTSEDKSKPDLKDVPVTREQLLSAINAATVLGEPMSNCAGARSGMTAPCRLTATATTLQFAGTAVDGIHIRVDFAHGKSVELDAWISSNQNLFVNQEIDGSLVYGTALTSVPPHVQVGMTYYSGFLTFRKSSDAEHAPLVLNAAILIPSVVTSIDRARDPICESSNPRTTSLANDSLLITGAGSKLGFSEQVMLPTPGLVPCMAQNVP